MNMQCSHIVWQRSAITKQEHAQQKGQKPTVLWFTGLSGSGKSTLADEVQQALFKNNHHTYLVEGDNLRHGLNKDLSFSETDRIENIRRLGETSRILLDAGLIVLCACISPFHRDRSKVKELFDTDEFIEIYLSTPLNTCEERDYKGLYKQARQGLIQNFTGISSPYEPPIDPDLVIDGSEISARTARDQVLAYLRLHNRINTF